MSTLAEQRAVLVGEYTRLGSERISVRTFQLVPQEEAE